MPLTSELISFTFNNKSSEISDATFSEFVLFEKLKANAAVTLDGGNLIDRPVEYAANSTVQAISGYDVVDTSAQTVFSQGQWDWREYVGTVSISATEQAKNNGKEAVVRLIDARKDNLSKSIRNKITTDLFAAQPAAGSIAIENLLEAIATNPATNPSRANYGAIDRVANTFWRNKYQVDVDSTLSATSLFSFAASGMDYLRIGYRKASRGPSVDTPDLHMVTPELYTAYENEMSPQLQIAAKSPNSGDIGFGMLKFMGAPVYWDAGLTGTNAAGHKWYMFNTKYWELVTHPDWNFKMGAFQEPVNQTVLTAKVVWQGNLICKNPKFQLVIAGFQV